LVTHATQLAAHCSRLIKLADGQIVSNNTTPTDV
jgi:predicted ABC-type transport system involved in lysophospholipase L1 biosynthesis ATPase subunit